MAYGKSMNIVFTGTAMVNGKHYDREGLTKVAETYGHAVQKKVNWNTDLLVVGDETHETTKKRDALRLRTKIVKIDQFLKMMFTV